MPWGVFISSPTDNQGFAAGIGIAVILFNYYSVSLAEHVSSTAAGSLVAVFVLVIGLGLLIRYTTKNESLAYGFYFLAVAGLLAVYTTTPEKFEGFFQRL